jgi:SAM-dependent methyltransferase
VADEQYAESFGFQWNAFRLTQLDSHTKLPLSQNRLFHATRWPTNMEGQRILEAGSGAGRFTEVLVSTKAQVFSFDLSTAVEANAANNGAAPNLVIFQASIYEIPLPAESFDKVICLGVLQHTPNPERSFRNLVRYLKPGGELAVDIYALRLRGLLRWKYLLRPITKRLSKEQVFRWTSAAVDGLLPLAVRLRRRAGRWGARLLPIVEYSHWGLSPELNRQWALLDTFDMYSPVHDHPKTRKEVRRWCVAAGLEDVVVEYGPNGIVARGRRSIKTK